MEYYSWNIYSLGEIGPRWLAGVARQARKQFESKTKRNKTQKDKLFISLPFIDDTLTRKVDTALRSVGLNLTASWKNDNTLTKRLVRSALERPPCRAGNRFCRTCASGLNGRCTIKNVVYEITCNRCSQIYIGETKRCIRYRFDEHFRDAKNRSQPMPLGDHMITCHPSESVSSAVSSYSSPL